MVNRATYYRTRTFIHSHYNDPRSGKRVLNKHGRVVVSESDVASP